MELYAANGITTVVKYAQANPLTTAGIMLSMAIIAFSISGMLARYFADKNYKR